MAMQVGDVIARFKSDLTGFKKGLQTASGEVKNFGSKAKAGLETVRNASLVVTGAIAGVATASMNFGAVAGKYESIRDAFSSMTAGMGIGVEDFEKKVADASRGTLDKLTILQGGTRALSLIGKDAFSDFGNQFADMAALSKKAARATGEDVTYMFDSLITGMSRESKMILDNLGITVDLTKAKKDYAEELGKSVDDLTTTEEKTAVLNHTLGKLEDTYGDVAVSGGGFSGAMSALKTEMTNAQIEIGTALLPVLNDLVRELTPIIKEYVPKLVEGISKGVKWFKELSPAGKKVVVVLVALAPILAAVSGAILLMWPLLIALPAIFGAIGVVIVAIGVAIALLLSPIGLLVAAGILLYKNWDKIVDLFNKVKDAIAGELNKRIEQFSGKIKELVEGIKDLANKGKQAFGNFVNWVKSGLQRVSDILTGFIDLIINGDFTGKFGRAIGLSEDSPIVLGILNLRDKIIEGFNRIKQALTDAVVFVIKIMQAIAAPFIWIKQNVIEPIMLLIQAIILRVLYEIYNFVVWLFTKIADFLLNSFLIPVYDFFVFWFTTIFNWIKDILTQVSQWIINVILLPLLAFFSYWLTKIYEFFVEKFNLLKNFIKEVLTFIKDSIIMPIFNAIKDFIAAAWDWIAAKTQQAWNWIKEKIVEPISAAFNKVKEFVKKMYDSAVGKFDAMLIKVREVWQKLKDAIVKPFEEAKRKVEEIAQKIKDAADKINPFHKESPSLVDNVQRGIKAIKSAYGELGAISPPSISGVGVGRGGDQILINMAGANITSPDVAEEYAEIIGDKIVRQLGRQVRV